MDLMWASKGAVVAEPGELLVEPGEEEQEDDVFDQMVPDQDHLPSSLISSANHQQVKNKTRLRCVTL